MFEKEKLVEGKYVFSLVMEENNKFQEMVGGLVFVERAFGLIKNEETDEPTTGGGGEIEIEPPDPPPGSGGDDGGLGEAP